jgi:proteasome accessory factor B
MFERDKDDLRRMGIPLQTVVDAAHGDEIGYRIDPSNAAMGAIDLTPAELAVVALAAEFWSDATVGADARQALTKVVSGSAPRLHVELPFAARSAASSDAIVVLAEAIHRRHAVMFEYAAASASGVSRRTIEPWHISMRGGAQYVTGFDRDRNEARTFRLSRILGEIKASGPDDAYSIPDPLPDHTRRGEEPLKRARIALRPESGHALRERGTLIGDDDGWDLIEVDYRYSDAIRDEVLALGGAARVVAPPEVAAEVRDHALRALEVSRG